MKKTITFIALALLASCTVGTSHHVTINQYGDSDNENGKFTNIIKYAPDTLKK